MVDPLIIGAIVVGALSAASYYQQRKMQRQAEKQANEMASHQISGHDSNRALYTVYGRALIGTTTIYKRVSRRNIPMANANFTNFVGGGGSPSTESKTYGLNRFLYRISSLSNGPINGIENVLIDGENYTANRFTAGHTKHFESAVSLGPTAGNHFANLRTSYATDFSAWGADKKGQGVAYVVERFWFDKSNPAYQGEPSTQYLVKGRSLYDPRLDSTVTGGSGSHRSDTPSTWAFSDNPALALLDMLTNDEYGRGVSHADCNMATFITAANKCDTLVDIPARATNTTGATMVVYDPHTGTTYEIPDNGTISNYRIDQVTTGSNANKQKRFRLNMAVDNSKEVLDNIQQILQSFRGNLHHINGEYVVHMDDVASPVLTLTDDDIIGGLKIAQGDRKQRINRMTVKFLNANKHYKTDQVSWPPIDSDASSQYQTYLTADSGEKLHKTVTLTGCTDYYQAEDIAEYLVRESRVTLAVSGTFGSRCFNLVPGDVIALDYDSAGYSGKYFIVDQVGVDVASMNVKLSLREYDSSVYTWNTARGNEPVALYFDEDQQYNATPTSLTLGTVSSAVITLADGTATVSLVVPYSGVPEEATAVEIGWAPTGTGDYTTNVMQEDATKTKFQLGIDNQDIDIRVRYIVTNADGLQMPSGYTSTTFTLPAVSGTRLDGMEDNATNNTGVLADRDTVDTIHIEADAVTAAKIDVTDIAAINADLGAITSGSLRSGNVTNPIPTDIFTRSSNQNIPTGSENGAFVDLDNGRFVFGDADSFISFADNSAGTARELDIKGVLAPTELDFSGVSALTVMPNTIKASGYADASIGKDALSEEAYNEIAARIGNIGGFYETGTGFYLGSTKYITLANTPTHGTQDVTVRVAISDVFTAPANFVANSNGVKVVAKLFYKLASDTNWNNQVQAGATQTFAASPTVLQYATRYTINASYEVTLTSGSGQTIADNTNYDFRVELTRLTSPNAFQAFGSGGANDSTGTPVTLEVSEGTQVVAGSGNADTLDNLDSTQFLRSDADDTMTGDLTLVGALKMGDTGRIELGDDTDLKISHSGGGGTVENDTGDLTIKNRAVDGDIYFQSDDGTGTGTDTYFYLDGGEKKVKFNEEVVISDDLTVTGNLTITGNIDQYNVTDLDVTDKTITVNSGSTQALSDGAGLIVDRGTAADASITWDETNDKFDFTHPISVTGIMSGGYDVANLYSGSTQAHLNVGRSSAERFDFYITDGPGYIRYYQDETDGTNHSVNFEIISSSSGTNQFYFNKQVNVTGHGNSSQWNTAYTYSQVGHLPLSGGTLTGRVTFPTGSTTKPILAEGFFARVTGDTSGMHDIWGISGQYYPSASSAADQWGIQWSGSPNEINFIGAGQKKLSIDLDTAGDVKVDGNRIWDAGDFTSTNISNWNTAYGWGDHSTQGYLTAEADTLATVTGRGSTTTNSITVGALTVEPSGSWGTGIVVNAGDTNTATGGAKQLVLSYGGSTSTDYAHSIRTRHDSAASATNTIEFWLWNYGTDSSSTVGTLQSLVLNKSALDLKSGGYDIDGNTVISSVRRFYASNGTVAKASYSFDGESNTGMYKYGANQIGFTVGGTLKAYIQDSTYSLVVSGKISSTGGNSDNWNTAYSRINEIKLGLDSTSLESFTAVGNYAKKSGFQTMMRGTSTNSNVVGTPKAASYWFYNVIGKRDVSNGTAALLMNYTGNDLYYGFTVDNTAAPTWRRVWDDNNFTQTNVNNWNTAYGWGDHSTAGYITGGTNFANDRLITASGANSLNGEANLTFNGTSLSMAGQLLVSHIGGNGGSNSSQYGIHTESSSAGQATMGAHNTGDGYANLNLSSVDDSDRKLWHISKRPSSNNHRLELFWYESGGFNSRYIFATNGDFTAHNNITANGSFVTATSSTAQGIYAGSTQVFEGSTRNLKNLGTISSGNITSSGAVSAGTIVSATTDLISNQDIQMNRSGTSPALTVYHHQGFRLVTGIGSGTSYTSTVGVNTSGIFYTNTGFAVNNTTLIDSSLNLTNIGTISSGVHTIYTTASALEGLNLVANVSSANQNSDSPKIQFNGEYQSNGPYIQGENAGAYGYKSLKFYTERSGSDYTTAPTLTLTLDSSGNAQFTGEISSGPMTSTGTSTIDAIEIDDDYGVRFGHVNQVDQNDGRISAGRHGTGLNIVGVQTASGTGRQVRVWGALIDDAGHNYIRDGVTNSSNLTITGVMQANNGYKIGSTTVINSSRNIINVVGITTENSSSNLVDLSPTVNGQILHRLWNKSTGASAHAVMRIANNGNTNQGTRLEFSDQTYYVGTVSADRTNGMEFYVGQMTNPTQSMRMNISNGGNVAIGTGVESGFGKLHIKDSDSGAAPYQSGNGGLTIERNGRAAINLLTPNTQDAYILFADPESANAGFVGYEHSIDQLILQSSGYIKAAGSGINIHTGILQMGGVGVIDNARNIQSAAISSAAITALGKHTFTGDNSTDGTLRIVANSAKGTRVSHVHYGTNGDWYIRSAGSAGTVFIQDGSGVVNLGTISSNLTFNTQAEHITFGSGGTSPSWSAPKVFRTSAVTIGISDYSGVQLGGYNGTAYGPRFTVHGTGNVDILEGALRMGTTTVISSVRRFYASTGTVAKAAFSFDGESNTGMYKYGTNQIGFTVGGTLKAYIQDSTYSLVVSGKISSTGGNSDNWNTAYTYSQVGHVPLAGGTMTGGLTVDLSTDSAFVTFERSGSEVGKIVYESATSRLTMGTGNSGLTFIDSGQDRIVPRKSGGGNANASIDLGDGASQWREIYLSGGLRVNSQLVIDSSRNIANVGTISSGSISSSGTLSASSYAAVGAIVAADPGSSYYSYNNRIGSGLAVVGTFNNFGNTVVSGTITTTGKATIDNAVVADALHVRGDAETGYVEGSMVGGISLWGPVGQSTSQIMFKATSAGSPALGNHGFCTNSYNTYFVMDTTNRGWVFRNATTDTNVASISNTGGAAFNNGIKINTTTVIDASRNFYNLETLNINNSSALSDTQVYIKKKDSGTNLQRWGEGTSGSGTYRFRIDQNFNFIANNAGVDNINLSANTGNITGVANLTTTSNVTVGGDLIINGTTRINSAGVATLGTTTTGALTATNITATSLSLSGTFSITSLAATSTVSGSQFRASYGSESAPAFTFKNDDDTGMYGSANRIHFAVSGDEKIQVQPSSILMFEKLVVQDELQVGTIPQIVVTTGRQLQNVTVSTSEAEYGQSLNGNFGQWLAHSRYAASPGFNSDVDYWGWNFVQGNINAPHTGSSQWYRNRVSLGNQYGHGISSGDYWLEMAYPRTTGVSGRMYIRACESGSIGSWVEVGSAIRGNSSVEGNAGIGTSPESGFGRLHIKDSDSGATPYQSGNGGITVERNGRTAINLLSPNTSSGYLFFGDPQSQVAGYIGYDHAATQIEIKSEGYVKTYGSGLDVTGGNVLIAGQEVISGARNITAVAGGFSGLLSNSAGAKLEIQNGTDGGNSRGIFMWTTTDTNWGIYMSTAGSGKSLAGGSASSGLDGRTSHAIRFRVASSSTQIGFLFENGLEQALAQITADSGNFLAKGNVTAYASDERLKTNIKPIERPLEKLMKLRGVEFDWIDGIEETHGFIPKCKHETGVIAQEVEQVIPDAISPAPFNNEYKTVEHTKIISLLIESVRSQQETIESLTKRIEELENGDN